MLIPFSDDWHGHPEAAAETLNVKLASALTGAVPPLRLGVLVAMALLSLLAGCTSTGDGIFSGEKIDYRSAAGKTQPLEVPPDLTQLARESRYQPQGGVVSAAAAGGAGASPSAAAAAASAPATVALASMGDLRVARDGQQRWLVVPQTPEALWPLVKAFWEQRGFTLAEENASAGVMETNWSENRAKLPADAIRNVIGRLFGNAYDTGERDRYRTRIERTATGSEIYISHRGIEENFTSERRESTAWRTRPADPQLEAELLSRLMVALGSKEEPARTAVAAAAPGAAASAGSTSTGAGGPVTTAGAGGPATSTGAGGPARASAAPQATTLNVNEPFDRAWRRVGLALDRSGFTVEDRDRAAGLYFVRYIDPKFAGKDDPSWWSRLWGDGSNPQAAQRYRIAVKFTGEKTEVAVLSSAGAAETSENAQRIVSLLVKELR